MQLIFATQNKNKAAEISRLLPSTVQILTLLDVNCYEDIPETGTTLEENALIKARFVFARFGTSCIADDSGLEVDVLDGAPGVFSARYAGAGKNAHDNMDLLLKNLNSKTNRNARFRTVIALIVNGNEYLFEGVVEGEITNEKSGKEGFGYDPIFKPNGYECTFAEMPLELKNTISHRGIAVRKWLDFMQNQFLSSPEK